MYGIQNNNKIMSNYIYIYIYMYIFGETCLSIFNDWFSNYNHINWKKLKKIRLNRRQKIHKTD